MTPCTHVSNDNVRMKKDLFSPPIDDSVSVYGTVLVPCTRSTSFVNVENNLKTKQQNAENAEMPATTGFYRMPLNK